MSQRRCWSCARPLVLGLLVVVGVALAGCGSSQPYPVRGKVLLRETLRPLKEGEVRFQSVSRPELVATGRIGADGVFSLSTSAGAGVPPGQYRAAVVVSPGGAVRVHPSYGEFGTSDLLYTVDAREGENYFLIEVSTKR